MTVPEVAQAARRVADTLDDRIALGEAARVLDTVADALRMLANELDPQETA